MEAEVVPAMMVAMLEVHLVGQVVKAQHQVEVGHQLPVLALAAIMLEVVEVVDRVVADLAVPVAVAQEKQVAVRLAETQPTEQAVVGVELVL